MFKLVIVFLALVALISADNLCGSALMRRVKDACGVHGMDAPDKCNVEVECCDSEKGNEKCTLDWIKSKCC